MLLTMGFLLPRYKSLKSLILGIRNVVIETTKFLLIAPGITDTI